MKPTGELQVLGVSFRSAPLAVRETLSFDPNSAMALLDELGGTAPRGEFAVLSTCNRTEFYLTCGATDANKEALLQILRRVRPQAPIRESNCQRYEFTGDLAVRHLFRVICGIESAVLGDVQILAQVKECRRIATQAGTLRKYLNEVFDQALTVGRRARAETRISHGNASVGSAVAGILSRHFAGLADGSAPRIVILGAGDVACSIARHLSKNRLGALCFVNRTFDRARRLAQLYGGDVREWIDLPLAIRSADAIITATSAATPFLTQAMLGQATSQRDAPPLVVDAGMPRNVEAGALVDVLNIDGIREQHVEVLRVREAAIPGVETLIDEQMKAWVRWRRSLPLEAVVKSLFVELEDHHRLAVGHLVGRQYVCRHDVDELLIRPMRRMVHQHVTRLRKMQSLYVND